MYFLRIDLFLAIVSVTYSTPNSFQYIAESGFSVASIGMFRADNYIGVSFLLIPDRLNPKY